MSGYERGNLLLRLADLIERNADDLAVLECLDNRKPARFTRLVEVEGAIKTFRYFACLSAGAAPRLCRESTGKNVKILPDSVT